MNLDTRFVTELLRNGKTAILRDKGIRANLVLGEAGLWFAFILKFSQQYGKLPTDDVMLREFPSFEADSGDEPLEFLCDEVLNRAEYNYHRDAFKRVQTCLKKKDTSGAMAAYRELAVQVRSLGVGYQLRDYSTETNARREAYYEMRGRLGLLGIPCGVDFIDENSLGWTRTDSVAICGKRASGKTWLWCRFLMAAWLAGEIPLAYTAEMAASQIERRLDALYSGVAYRGLRSGRLTTVEEERYLKDLEEMKEQKPFYVCDGRMSPEEVSGLADDVGATIVGVDAAMRMVPPGGGSRGKSHWERVMDISQAIKTECNSGQRPWLSTWQMSRGKNKGGLDDVAYSDAVGQDCDYAVQFVRDEKTLIVCLKNREDDVFATREVSIDFDNMDMAVVSVEDDDDSAVTQIEEELPF